MKFVTQDEPDLTLPEDSIHRARLEDLNHRTFEWTDYKTGEKKQGETLEWYWAITSSSTPEYIGHKVRGECKPILSNRDGNRFRMWAEALLNREIPVGMAVETDDLVGLEAEIVIGHRVDKKDPSKKWPYVTDVAPLDGSSQVEPPF